MDRMKEITDKKNERNESSGVVFAEQLNKSLAQI